MVGRTGGRGAAGPSVRGRRRKAIESGKSTAEVHGSGEKRKERLPPPAARFDFLRASRLGGLGLFVGYSSRSSASDAELMQ